MQWAEQSILQEVEEYMLMHATVLGLIMIFWGKTQQDELKQLASSTIGRYMREKYGISPVTWT
jgi:hypothetical protein